MKAEDIAAVQKLLQRPKPGKASECRDAGPGRAGRGRRHRGHPPSSPGIGTHPLLRGPGRVAPCPSPAPRHRGRGLGGIPGGAPGARPGLEVGGYGGLQAAEHPRALRGAARSRVRSGPGAVPVRPRSSSDTPGAGRQAAAGLPLSCARKQPAGGSGGTRGCGPRVGLGASEHLCTVCLHRPCMCVHGQRVCVYAPGLPVLAHSCVCLRVCSCARVRACWGVHVCPCLGACLCLRAGVCPGICVLGCVCVGVSLCGGVWMHLHGFLPACSSASGLCTPRCVHTDLCVCARGCGGVAVSCCVRVCSSRSLCSVCMALLRRFTRD